jgi:hypothetical protein
MRNVRRLSPVSVDVCRIATHTFGGGTFFHWCAKCATPPGKQPESTNAPFLYEHRGTPAEYKAGLDLAVARGWLKMHESGTYVKFTQTGAELFA